MSKKDPTKITVDEAKKMMLATDGKIFAVKFIKRTTGELREMTCRLGVTSHLHGGELPYDPKIHKLLPVFDMDIEQYRQIPYEGLRWLRTNGVWLEVIQPEAPKTA